MKRNILKKYNYIIAFLLSVLGVGGACTLGGCEYGTPAEEYGTPSATFKVNGIVSSEDNTKIPNIRVVMQSDTVYTDLNGAYNVQTSAFPDDQNFLVEFEDIDGTANGIYQSKDTMVLFDNPQFENGDGSWYIGETSKEINIKLKSGN
jgi:putative lipoprotein (rSAM/lipoprotein system)